MRYRIPIIALVVLCIGAFMFFVYHTPQDVQNVAQLSDGKLQVHFIDVGQGDATLLISPEVTILVDAGRHDSNEVVPYLKQVGVKEIDLLVGTHPHSDHIGQMDKVLQNFPVADVWMSGDHHTSNIFERVLDEILASDANYREPRTGEVYEYGNIHISITHPIGVTGEFNNGSIGMHVQYGDIALLFTGDAEEESEKRMLSDRRRLQAQIYHVGHHGSSTSNTKEFLQAVAPELAVYSAGVDNTYGHPHKEVVSLFAEMDIPLLGTDNYGTIVVETDGKSYRVLEGLLDKDSATSKDSTVDENLHSDDFGKVNLNTASREELKQIIHIGEERVDELISYRPYTSVNQLKKIYGIGSGRLNDIKKEGRAYVD